MKKNTLLTLILLTTGVISAFAQGAWTTKASLGAIGNGRSKAAGFELNGMGYIGTGYNGTAKNDFWQYDPATNVWTQKANFGGTARYGAFGFSVNGFGFIGAGFASPTYTKDVWKYNATANTWTAVANFGGTGRMDATSFVIGNKAYVGTGLDGSSVKNDFWRYNPTTDTWTARANYGGSACCNATGFALSGKGYICLGRNATTTYYNTTYQYDTTANTWTARANYSGAAREGAAAFVIANEAFVGTGGSNSLATLYNDFYKYDPILNSWSVIAPFIGSLRSHANGLTIGNYGYVGMGYTGGQVNNFYKYSLCAITNTITATPPSCNGGNNGSINLTVIGAVNPTTYLWSNTNTMEDPTGLVAGNYSVVISDVNGCTATNSVSITAPTVLSNSVTYSNPTCNAGTNGSVNLTTAGGTIPYTYAWSNANTTEDITGISAGNYTVQITDANGCSSTNTVSLTAPTSLSVSISSTIATCPSCLDGIATATVTGGTSPYSYAWTPSGNTTQSVTNLGTGNYTLCVTDSNNCNLCDTVDVGYFDGITEYYFGNLSIFPIPNKGEFTITGLRANAELSIFNCVGELIYQSNTIKKQENIILDKIPEGIYFLKLKTKEAYVTRKIIILK